LSYYTRFRFLFGACPGSGGFMETEEKTKIKEEHLWQLSL